MIYDKMGQNAKEFSNYNWNSLEKRIYQMLIGNSSEAMINWGTTLESSKRKKISQLECYFLRNSAQVRSIINSTRLKEITN